MHEVLVNRLGGLSLPRESVVRLTDRPDMTLDVYRGRKTTIQQQPNGGSMTKHRTTKHRKAKTRKRKNIERLNIEKKDRKKFEITSKKFRNIENCISIHVTTTILFRYREHISGILR